MNAAHVYQNGVRGNTAVRQAPRPEAPHTRRTSMPTLHLEMHPGRTLEQKRDFVREVTRVASETLACPPARRRRADQRDSARALGQGRQADVRRLIGARARRRCVKRSKLETRRTRRSEEEPRQVEEQVVSSSCSSCLSWFNLWPSVSRRNLAWPGESGARRSAEHDARSFQATAACDECRRSPPTDVIPAKAGIHFCEAANDKWIPA